MYKFSFIPIFCAAPLMKMIVSYLCLCTLLSGRVYKCDRCHSAPWRHRVVFFSFRVSAAFPFSKGLSAAAWSVIALFPWREVWHAGCQIFKTEKTAHRTFRLLCLWAWAYDYMFQGVYCIIFFIYKKGVLPVPCQIFTKIKLLEADS